MSFDINFSRGFLFSCKDLNEKITHCFQNWIQLQLYILNINNNSQKNQNVRVKDVSSFFQTLIINENLLDYTNCLVEFIPDFFESFSLPSSSSLVISLTRHYSDFLQGNFRLKLHIPYKSHKTLTNSNGFMIQTLSMSESDYEEQKQIDKDLNSVITIISKNNKTTILDKNNIIDFILD